MKKIQKAVSEIARESSDSKDCRQNASSQADRWYTKFAKGALLLAINQAPDLEEGNSHIDRINSSVSSETKRMWKNLAEIAIGIAAGLVDVWGPHVYVVFLALASL